MSISIKNKILNLFLDNNRKDITPSDMRIFVNNIFDTKENTIRKLDEINDLNRVYPNPILKNDIILIYNDFENNGIYLVKKDNPTKSDIQLISGNSRFLDELSIIESGENNQVLSVKDNTLTWVPMPTGYKILGTKKIRDILVLKPIETNVIYIAENTDYFSYIPGKKGEGYSWDGNEWSNIGQITGLDGEPGIDGELSELEKINEDGHIGWRIRDRNADNHGQIGHNAIDFSYSDVPSILFGATGARSFALGYRTTASGENSVAIGTGTIANQRNSLVIGSYNEEKSDSTFLVGSGTDSTRENSFEVYEDGRVHGPKITLEQQENEHSFVTRKFINQMTVDGEGFIK